MLTTSPQKTIFVEKPEEEPRIIETSSKGGQGPEGVVAPWKKKKKKKKITKELNTL